MFKTFAIIFASTAFIITGICGPAHATKRKHVRYVTAEAQNEQAGMQFFNPFLFGNQFSGNSKPAYAGGTGGRPRAWCGWWARQQVGQDPGPEFNLVSSWRKWGSQTGPTPGAIAIWRGARHVGKVVSVEGGEVCTTSGNSGGKNGGVNTRCEPMSHFEQFRS